LERNMQVIFPRGIELDHITKIIGLSPKIREKLALRNYHFILDKIKHH
jgi:hypothetical protein